MRCSTSAQALLGALTFSLATVSFAVPATAQTIQNDEIVSVGSLSPQTEKQDLTSPVSVISARDLDARNQAFLSDILRSLPGLSVNRSGPGGALTQLRLRGSEASHILVIIDGIEVANPTAGEFDLSGIRAEDIIRIELLRGEQSALYGSDAVGGVLNIVTQSAQTKPQFQTRVEAGNFDTYNGQISATVPLGEASLSVSGGALNTQGYDISQLDGERDGSQSRSINVGLNNVVLGPVTFTAKLAASGLAADYDEDSDFDGRLNDTNSQSFVDTISARIGANFTTFGIDHRLSAVRHHITTDTRAGFSSRSEGERDQIRWVASRDVGVGTLSVLGEMEEERYEITPSFAFDPTAPENTAYALAGEYRISNGAFDLNLSARQDFNDRFDDATTWKVGAGYALTNVGGRLRASIGTGVKNPSLIELFGFYPEANFVGNPDLKPETSLGFNIGYEQSLMGDAMNFSVDYFRSDLEDEIFTDFSSFPFLPRNRTTDSEREGVEFEARWAPREAFNVRASATYLDATENGVEEIRRPEFLASLSGVWHASEAVMVGVHIDHTGSQIDTDFATFSPVTLDAFTRIGANLAYDVNDIVTLTLRGENLLDEEYEEVVGYGSQGRGVFVGMRARFN